MNEYTVLFCQECCSGCGLKTDTKIGGTACPEKCQLCGKNKFLFEHKTRISLEAIREDAK